MQRIGHQHDPSLKSVTNISAARIKVDPLYRTLIFPVWVEDDFNKVGYVFPVVRNSDQMTIAKTHPTL